MLIILILLFIFFLLVSPFFRMLLKNLHNVGIYSLNDLYDYVINRKWLDFNLYGIDMFVGMFGHGKTLSMVHRARLIYEKYGDKVRFISNVHLIDIPYIELTNFNQLVELGENPNDDYIGNIILIDEIENVLSNRKFASFPLELMHSLTQQRKLSIYIMCSAQRFFMVDKLFRSITTNVYDCNKIWRFQNMKLYDAWDYEQAMNPQLLKYSQNIWWFVKDKDYNSYDTSQMIMKNAAEDFISNEESIVRKGLDSMTNESAIKKPKKKKQKSKVVK